MTVSAMIVCAFGVSLALSTFTRVHPAAWGCLLPVAATVALILMVSFGPGGTSTSPVGIPFAFLFTAIGSIPGAFAGAGLRSLLYR